MYRYTTQGEFINKSLRNQLEKFTNQMNMSEGETLNTDIEAETLLKKPHELTNESDIQAKLDKLKNELLNSK